MRKLLKNILVSSLLIALSWAVSFSAEAGCTTAPSCAELGFTKDTTSCDSGQYILKCPSDTSKAFCVEKQTQLYVGDIYYSDGTFSRDVVSGKTAIGIVFWVSNDRDAPVGSKALVAALEGSQQYWTVSGNYWDVDSLPNITNSTTALADMDGKGNTSKIIAYKNSHSGTTFGAAEYCTNYRTNGTSLGQWFLPALGQLQQLYNAKAYVNASLSLLGKSQLPTGYHWSSTEYDYWGAWILDISDGSVNASLKTNHSSYVRPVLAL